MSQTMKEATFTATVPHLTCDKAGCGAMCRASGLQETDGWIRVTMFGAPAVLMDTGAAHDPTSGGYLFRDDSKHLCPEHAQAFVKFVEGIVKYLQKSFKSAPPTDAYREAYDRIFKKASPTGVGAKTGEASAEEGDTGSSSSVSTETAEVQRCPCCMQIIRNEGKQ